MSGIQDIQASTEANPSSTSTVTTTTPEATSLVNSSAAPAAWAEYANDDTKSPEDNAAAKAAHDATKPAPAPAPIVHAPLTSEAIVLPEGVTLDDASRTELVSIMNNAELDPVARTNALLELNAKVQKAASEAGSAQWQQTQEAWRKEVVEDATLGGANLPKTLANVGRVMDTFGNEEIRAIMDSSGLGNNKVVVSFLSAIGATLSEAKPVTGGPGATGGLTTAQKMYPNQK